MNKHEKPKTNKIGKIILTGLTSLYNVICSCGSTQILMDIQKKLGTDYRYADIFTLNN